jgi:hypothetical protein
MFTEEVFDGKRISRVSVHADSILNEQQTGRLSNTTSSSIANLLRVPHFSTPHVGSKNRFDIP